MNWKKARKKPLAIEYRGPYYQTDTIDTIEGEFTITKDYLEEHGGYVVIRGVDNEIYPCALDIFRETYTTNTTLEHDVIESWVQKANSNIQDWGLQSMDTLLLAMQEELGELTQAYLEYTHENESSDQIPDELDDLAALLIQFRRSLHEETIRDW